MITEERINKGNIIDVGVAYQKKVRDEKSISDCHNLFGNYWDDIDKDIKKAIIKPVDLSFAGEIIKEYEWLHCMPAFSLYAYGIFFGQICGGVVVFSPEYIENLGRWDKYGYTGKILLLSRGVCLHWTPINTNSKLIMSAIKMLPSKYKVITATTDHLAGEIGTIYQACNFHYVGSMRDANPNVNSKNGDRDGWLIDGKLYGSRAMRVKFGTTKLDEIRKKYPNVEKVKQNSKHRYFLFTGSKREIKLNKSAIEHLIKQFPKRKSG